MGVTLRTNFADLLDPNFRQIFFERFGDTPTIYQDIFKLNSSTKSTEKDSSISAIGKWAEKTEGAEVNWDSIYQGYDKTYTHKTWSDGFIVTREMYDDDQFNKMNNLPAQLGIGAAITVDGEGADVFNNAFDTSYTGGDGYCLCSASHPRPDGGDAQSNLDANTLTETNLETAIVNGAGILSGKGVIVGVQYNTLLVPAALEKEAVILMKSMLRSGTGNNDTNAYLNDRFKIVVWPRLTSATNWFLIDSRIAQLNHFWRVAPEFDSWMDGNTKNSKHTGYMRFIQGWSDWRGVYGGGS